mgnify:CR=1 FL=1
MIIDNLKNIDRILPQVNERMQQALKFLAGTDLQALSGKTEIDGRRIHVAVSEYATKAHDEKKAETHLKYIDIQMVVQGAERVYTHELTPELPIVEDKREEKDAIFYAVQESESHVLTGDRFAVYYPWEVHRPGCNVADEPQQVKKIVVKVLLD